MCILLSSLGLSLLVHVYVCPQVIPGSPILLRPIPSWEWALFVHGLLRNCIVTSKTARARKGWLILLNAEITDKCLLVRLIPEMSILSVEKLVSGGCDRELPRPKILRGPVWLGEAWPIVHCLLTFYPFWHKIIAHAQLPFP